MKYAVLLKPNNNMPYFEEMKKMCVYETKILFNRLKVSLEHVEVKQMGKAYYLIIETKEEIEAAVKKYISKLSFYYTMFEISADRTLRPLDIEGYNYLSDDLSIRLKYNGKTNETFTRLLLNTALYSTDFYHLDKVNVLDPVCGRGTTLFEALIQGFDAYGVDQDKKAISDMGTYLLRFLKEGKYKHSAQSGKASMNGKNLGEFLEINMGDTKEAVKNKTGKNLKVLRGDTTHASQYFKKKSMHVIVGDLPYGVQHMSKNNGESVRSLDDLLDASFKAWYALLKKGGAMALSWNTYTNKRADLVERLEKAGFTVIADENYGHFFHRVSQAINRDILVAKKL